MPNKHDPTTSDDPEIAFNAAINEIADNIHRRDDYYMSAYSKGVGFDKFFSKDIVKAHAKERDDYLNNPDHFNPKAQANRRLVARVPLEVAHYLKKMYGEDVLRNPDKFWDVMNMDENKLWLRAKE